MNEYGCMGAGKFGTRETKDRIAGLGKRTGLDEKLVYLRASCGVSALPFGTSFFSCAYRCHSQYAVTISDIGSDRCI